MAVLAYAGTDKPCMSSRAGFKSRQILCVPVADASENTIGAIQIINTHDGLPFGPTEFNMLRAFRPFVQMAILKRDDAFAQLLVAAPQQLAKHSAFRPGPTLNVNSTPDPDHKPNPNPYPRRGSRVEACD